MALGGLIRGGAKASDEAGEAASRGLDFSDDSYRGRVGALGVDRAFDVPVQMTDSATSTLSDVAKYGAAGTVGGTGIYFGSQAYEDRQGRLSEEARQASAQEYSAATEEIMNDENLTPEQKQDALDNLQNMADDALDPSAGATFFENFFGDLGLIEKLLLAAVVIIVVRGMAERYGGGN